MSDGNGKLLSADNPFAERIPLIEKSALKRTITKEQAVDYATRIAYGMCQKLFESLAAKMNASIETLNKQHTDAMERLAQELRKEIAEAKGANL